MKKRLLILLSVCFICVSIFPSSPKYEMRAVWITTNWGLDWPSRPVKVLSDRYIQQKELCCILDELLSSLRNVINGPSNATLGSSLFRWDRIGK